MSIIGLAVLAVACFLLGLGAVVLARLIRGRDAAWKDRRAEEVEKWKPE